MKYNGITVRSTPLSVFARLMTVACLPLGIVLWLVMMHVDRKDGLVVSWWDSLCETYGYLFDLIVAGNYGDY